MTSKAEELTKRPAIKIYIPPPKRSEEGLQDVAKVGPKLKHRENSEAYECQQLTEDMVRKFGRFSLDSAEKEESFENGLVLFESAKHSFPKSIADKCLSKIKQPDLILNFTKLAHIIELYDFPSNADTISLQSELYGFEQSGFFIKWVDDTHCLVVFSSPTEARQALKQISGILMKARPVEEACTASKMKIAKSPGDWAMPFKRRPPSDSSVASRIISSHLGLARKPIDPEALRARNEAKERERERRRHKKAVWNDD